MSDRCAACLGVLQAVPGREYLDRRRTECHVHQLERTAVIKHEVDEVSVTWLSQYVILC